MFLDRLSVMMERMQLEDGSNAGDGPNDGSEEE